MVSEFAALTWIVLVWIHGIVASDRITKDFQHLLNSSPEELSAVPWLHDAPIG